MTVSTFLRQRALEYRTIAAQIPFEALRTPLLQRAQEWEELANKSDTDLRQEG